MKNLFLLYWFAVAYHFKMIVISRATALFRYARRSHMIYACHSGMKIICRLSIDSFQIKPRRFCHFEMTRLQIECGLLF